MTSKPPYEPTTIKESGRVLSCPECGYQFFWRDGEPLPTVQHSDIPGEHALVRVPRSTPTDSAASEVPE